MSTTRPFLSLSFLLAFALTVSADIENGGILNGPLNDRRLGHRADGEGTKESLQRAIEELMARYGTRYPKGAEFLERLENAASGHPRSTEFLALKREALLLENPAIDFDTLLLVRAGRNGKRYANNWQTRASCDPESRIFDESDVVGAVHGYQRDPTLKALYAVLRKAEKAWKTRKRDIDHSKAYRAERNPEKREELYARTPEHAALKRSRKELHEAAMQHPAYAAAHRKLGSRVPSYDDALVALPIKTDGAERTLYQPKRASFIGDVDLHFEANRLLFSSFRDTTRLSPGPSGGKGKGYATFELPIDPETGAARAEAEVVSPDMGADVDCYDACYLPDDRILFASTASYDGVPCVGGNSYVANLFRMNRDGSDIRRLTFDQDGNWHPSVLENGRVMYLRWEYTDMAHYFSRILMTMNPDGTDQKAWYGSNSYWPNSLFHARQIPGNTSRFIGSITGHHSNPKGGALCLFDVSKGRHEADGAIQFLTGHGKPVAPLVIDALHNAYSPMLYNPYPIDDQFFLATAGDGSVYLLDVFDNMVCLKKAGTGRKYYEPIPLRKSMKPKITPDRVNVTKKDATVLISDVYAGPGLHGVPRGEVKDLRVYSYEYGPRHKGGHYSMGMEAGWDVKRILGTVPVETDGSVHFTVPANTPFAMQPLDPDGRALQLMRSWTVAMPGEVLSCVGCHESQDTTPPVKRYAAMGRAPSKLKPFYGAARGFSFTREVQPVLDRYCVSCHDGQAAGDRFAFPNRIIGTGPHTGKKFAEVGIPDLREPWGAHQELHPYVRRNGPEGDNHLLTPLEFHTGTSELFQMLAKGHCGVELDRKSLDRLVTWADLNAPFHGTWTEAGAKPGVLDRRKELRAQYAFVEEDPEKIVNPYLRSEEAIMPSPPRIEVVAALPPEVTKQGAGLQSLDLGSGISMALVGIPAGEFSMGSNTETPMEQPVSRVKIDEPFAMGATEVTLAQYRQFDPDHLNGVYDMHYKDQVHRGYYMNDMEFPVIRVSWQKAMAFCQWLSGKTGEKVRLPTEAQWEWACRAGTLTPLSFGDLDANFSRHANLADRSVKRMAVRGVNPRPIENPDHRDDFELKDPRSDDGALHLAEAGSYQANPWGLFDMHGNAAEWTRSDYRPYPYRFIDGRNQGGEGDKAVRGGSWHDRMFRASSSFRLGFPPWQQVYHVGFRVVVEYEE